MSADPHPLTVDDLDNLRIGNSSNVSAESEATFADDFLDTIGLHG